MSAVGGLVGGLRVCQLPVSSLRVDEVNPRQELGELWDLAASIRAQGVTVPLVVRRRPEGAPDGPEDGPGRYGVLSGSRRLAAARLVGLETVPCVVRDDLDDEGAAVLALAENLGRRSLSPIEEARALRRLMDAHGLTQLAAAERCGMSQGTVSVRMALLDGLTPEEQERVASGSWGVEAALEEVRRRRRGDTGGGAADPDRGNQRGRGGWWALPQGVANLEQPASGELATPGERRRQAGVRRRQAIAELLRTRVIVRSDDLLPLLAERGFEVGKNQVCRDLRELGAAKVDRPASEPGEWPRPQSQPMESAGPPPPTTLRLVPDPAEPETTAPSPNGHRNRRTPNVQAQPGSQRGVTVQRVALRPGERVARVPPGKVAVLVSAEDAERVEAAARVRGVPPGSWLHEVIVKAWAGEGLAQPMTAATARKA